MMTMWDGDSDDDGDDDDYADDDAENGWSQHRP